MFGADLRTPFHHQRGGQPPLTEPPKRQPGPITASRGVKLLVRVVPVAPAVGEPLAEPGARDLPAKLRLQALACRPGARSDRPRKVAQLRLHVRLERTGEAGCKLQVSSSSRHCLRAAFDREAPLLVDAHTPLCPLLGARQRPRWADAPPLPSKLNQIISTIARQHRDG
jgi:hypothetical protein